MRVIAIESIENGVMRFHGEGEYLGLKVPDVYPLNEAGFTNPCIKLDNGKYVWGFQCWWQDVEEFRRQNENISEEIIVDIIDEILPYEKKPKKRNK